MGIRSASTDFAEGLVGHVAFLCFPTRSRVRWLSGCPTALVRTAQMCPGVKHYRPDSDSKLKVSAAQAVVFPSPLLSHSRFYYHTHNDKFHNGSISLPIRSTLSPSTSPLSKSRRNQTKRTNISCVL